MKSERVCPPSPPAPCRGSTGPDARILTAAAAAPPPKSLSLDPVCVADDAAYGGRLQSQLNLPPAFEQALKAYY